MPKRRFEAFLHIKVLIFKMKNFSPINNFDFSALSNDQLETLRLAADRKTSKEIARILAISPYTVDQRLTLARKKLKIGNRRALIGAYVEYTTICDRTVYQPDDLDPVFASVQSPQRLEIVSKTAEKHPHQFQLGWKNSSARGAVSGLEVFRFRGARPLRIREAFLFGLLLLFLALNLYGAGEMLASLFN